MALYRSAADAMVGRHPYKDFLVVGDYVSVPATSNDDPEPNFETLGGASCVRYVSDHGRPASQVFGFVKSAVLGAFAPTFAQMSTADRTAFLALPPRAWPARAGGDGSDTDDFMLAFFHAKKSFELAKKRAPEFSVLFLVDPKHRWADAQGDDQPGLSECGFSVFLLNNAIVIPNVPDISACFGNHGAYNPAGVYKKNDQF